MGNKYDVAAYVWPSYTGDEPRTRIFWPEGIGEWQTVKNAAPKGDYNWDRKPLWGYVNEADPRVMEMQIDEATKHGVNVFIYDWYWYDRRPFLEGCLNNGFLGASNHDKMKFYLMWANHNATSLWDIRTSERGDLIWSGEVDLNEFRRIGRRWIEKYFTLDCYYRIDGKPVLCIYEADNFISGLGGLDNARAAIEWLDGECRAAGLNGLHLQLIKYGRASLSFWEGNAYRTLPLLDVYRVLGCESLTHYQYVHFVNITLPAPQLLEGVENEWKSMENCGMTYFPHVSAGWDNNPRFRSLLPHYMPDPSPELFEAALEKAKVYADAHNTVPLVTVNSWNEWTETSYLEPDNKTGYAYLDAVKRVFAPDLPTEIKQ